MTITISCEELLLDVRNTSHNEVANIADPEARYRAEAGSEKDELVKRCILEGVSRAKALGIRYLDTMTEEYDADNGGDIPYDWTIYIAGGQRRLWDKSTDIANLFHSVIVNLALSRFYLSVMQGELAKVHDEQAKSVAQELIVLLNEKRPPVPINYTRHIEE